MTFEQWDVVVVPFPFVDAPETKPRPALVLSRRGFNEQNRHTVLAMITTAKGDPWPSDHAIRDQAGAGLRAPSVVRCKIFTLDNRMIQRRIGRLEAHDRTACEQTLERVFKGL